MEMNMARFETGDLWLSAFLLTCGIHPSLEKMNGTVNFVFPSSPELNQLIVNYQSGCTVKAVSFANAAKLLRGQLLALKKSGL